MNLFTNFVNISVQCAVCRPRLQLFVSHIVIRIGSRPILCTKLRSLKLVG